LFGGKVGRNGSGRSCCGGGFGSGSGFGIGGGDGGGIRTRRNATKIKHIIILFPKGNNPGRIYHAVVIYSFPVYSGKLLVGFIKLTALLRIEARNEGGISC